LVDDDVRLLQPLEQLGMGYALDPLVLEQASGLQLRQDGVDGLSLVVGTQTTARCTPGSWGSAWTAVSTPRARVTPPL